MFFDSAGHPDGADDAEFTEEEWQEIRAVQHTPPDALSMVLSASSLMNVFAADRLRSIRDFERDFRYAHREELTGHSMHRDMVLRSMRLELASALRITEYAAEELLAFAHAMVVSYPTALIALQQSDITEKHASILVDQLARLPLEQRYEFVDEALELAKAHPVGTFRRKIKELIDRLLNEEVAERQERALAERRVCVEPAGDGMAWLNALIPEVEAHAIFERLTGIAKAITSAPVPASDADDASFIASNQEPDAARTRDQVRADALCDLLIDGETDTHPEEARGIRANVVVTVPALSLMSDEHAEGAEPATVEAVGPIPIRTARRLAGGAESWMRVLTHPETGMVLSVGRTQYRPPAALRKLVRWRAERCMAPGCSIPASRCEIDHTLAWIDGGHTSLQNNAPLCKGHHTVKHHGNWLVTQIADSGGALLWRSPTGREYRVEPERRVPSFTPAPF